MEEKIDKRVWNQLYIILEKMPYDMKIKISKKFIKYIVENKDENYEFKYDETKPLDKQELLEDTKSILTIICLNYFCEENERKELEKILKKNNNGFKKNNFPKNEINKSNLELIKVEPKIWEKILNVLKKIFKYKK